MKFMADRKWIDCCRRMTKSERKSWTNICRSTDADWRSIFISSLSRQQTNVHNKCSVRHFACARSINLSSMQFRFDGRNFQFEIYPRKWRILIYVQQRNVSPLCLIFRFVFITINNPTISKMKIYFSLNSKRRKGNENWIFFGFILSVNQFQFGRKCSYHFLANFTIDWVSITVSVSFDFILSP